MPIQIRNLLTGRQNARRPLISALTIILLIAQPLLPLCIPWRCYFARPHAAPPNCFADSEIKRNRDIDIDIRVDKPVGLDENIRVACSHNSAVQTRSPS